MSRYMFRNTARPARRATARTRAGPCSVVVRRLGTLIAEYQQNRLREATMNIVAYLHGPAPAETFEIIDGVRLITPARATRGVKHPPLTLYGAYRQGIDDYFACRANPYLAGSRFAAIWREGHNEAAARAAA
jgi:hypothetical protein